MAKRRRIGKIVALCAGVAMLGLNATGAQAAREKVEVVVSSLAGDRLKAKAGPSFAAATAAPTFTIEEDKPQQKILGFGATFMEAGMIVLSDLAPAKQEEVLQAMFDPKAGAGFTAMVTYMGSTDYQSAGPYFTYADKPGDVELESFSVERDFQPNGVATYIKRAQKYGDFILHSRLDYPPNWMMLMPINEKGMILDSRYYKTLANYYLKYVQAYKEKGIDINYLSLFNEPGFYTKISYSEIGDLIREHVGPLFEKEGLKTRFQIADAPFRDWAYKMYPQVLDNPETRKYIGSMTYHGYDFLFGPAKEAEAMKHLSELHSRYPDIPLWLTEHCYHRDSIMFLGLGDMTLPRLDFEDGDFWGKQIANELDAGASAWSYFNAVLDENGGPNFASEELHQYKKENVQHAVIVIDRKKKQVHYTGLYYYLAHFSKYVRPGAVKLTTTGSQKDVRLLSFKGPDQKIVTQVINSAKTPTKINVAWRGQSLSLTLPAVSISTVMWPGSTKTASAAR